MPPEKRTIRAITKELVGHPFFPLLFLAEFVKYLVEGGLTGPYIVEYAALAAASTVIWVLSDAITVDVDTDSIVGERGD